MSDSKVGSLETQLASLSNAVESTFKRSDFFTLHRNASQNILVIRFSLVIENLAKISRNFNLQSVEINHSKLVFIPTVCV